MKPMSLHFLRRAAQFSCILSLAAAAFLPLSARAQGSLTPPSGAISPTMKSLDQIEPRTPISSLPYAINTPGSYYVTTNLTGITSNDGITINTGDVALDLNGFTLTGVAGSGNAIYVSAVYDNITIRNGYIVAWGGSGVNVYNGENTVLDHLSIFQTSGYAINMFGGVARNCTVDGSGGSASIYCEKSVVQDCTVINSQGIGIETGSSANDGASKISDCSVYSPAGDGMDAFDSEVSDCVVKNAGASGIYLSASTASGCHVENSFGSGIYVASPGCRITGNNCLNNNSSASTNSAGIYVAGSNNRIENNHLTANLNAGIQVDPNGYTNNIIIKNTVAGDGTNDIVTSTNAQIVGPLIITTGVITNSNPWANFSF
ncbi:MAG: right-handed parallel beta-helix repeat-containing protein [Verrucomicrobia bacterium]|nr:right-handed parallel beta-helix repeat-containing protein [Verrucomicrobiota bacterium]MDE3099233.1 right-handed parallel beta-helix repeat-containing protein [Verrucomicrobiota bacterium]